VLRVITRFCDAYPEDSRLQEELGLSAFEDALVRLPYRYPNPVQIGRFDAVLGADGIRFVELNADTPASMGYADVAYSALEALRPSAGRRHHYAPLVPSVVATLVAVHRAARRSDARLPRSPRVAVVDVTTTSWHDIQMAVDALRAAGIETVRATPEQLRYDGSRLEADGLPIDLLYRRILLEDLEAGDMTAAATDGRVTVVNAFRARIANNKKLLALLQDPRFSSLVARDEAQAVSSAVPWTRVVRSGPVRHEGRTVELGELCAAHRERLVIKPAVGYAGQDVHIGDETSQGDWEAVLRRVLDAETHVVQEFVAPPEVVVPVLQDGTVATRRARVNVSVFMIGGRCAGMMARLADRHMVNLAAGGAFLSCVEAERPEPVRST
jgi:glutathionylspermidine synthase